MVVIQNGQLKLQLKNDVNKDEFTNSIRKVLGADAIPGSNATQTQSPAQVDTPEIKESEAHAEAEDEVDGPSEPSAPTRLPASSAVVSTPSAAAKGKQRATVAQPQKTSTTPSAAQQAARDALRKKKREEAEELARVKARIEADKAERRAQAEARRLEREKEKNQETQLQNETHTRATASTRGSQAKTVNLNVRLFDGRTIRSTFPRTATLQKEVRSWVDTEFAKLSSNDPNINNQSLPPYFFRHILSPQPSRELSAGDENQTLGDIDLAPSATLVLVPVKGYTEAYSGTSGGVVGTATGLVGGAFGLLSSTVGFVGSTLGSVIGYGSAPAEPSSSAQTSESRAGPSAQQPAGADGSTIRVRTLADQRAREPRNQQFYNGNQVSRLR